MAIKLIALDLDGTLLVDHLYVSEENHRALAEARAQGAEIVIASGRPLYNISADLFRELGVNYAITANGACVYRLSDNEMIYADPMESAAAQEIMDLCESMPVMACAFLDDFALISKSKSAMIDYPRVPEGYRIFLRRSSHIEENAAAYLRESGKAVYKIGINFNNFTDDPEAYYVPLRQRIEADPRFVPVDGGGRNIEITMAGVSKGKALHWLAAHLGVDISETMACGDTENDMEMLKAAGIGVAMENAEPHVKAAADFVTKSCEEDGVAYAIRKFLNT